MSHGAGHALDASVLVLNRFYMAVHVVSVRRAVLFALQGVGGGHHRRRRPVRVIQLRKLAARSPRRGVYKEPDDDFIRTVHFEIQVPRIIRLLTYGACPV